MLRYSVHNEAAKKKKKGIFNILASRVMIWITDV